MKIKVVYLVRALLGAGLFLCLHFAIVTGFPTPAVSQTVAQTLAQNAGGASNFQTLAKADELYLKGELAAAEAIYRQVKPPFPDAAQDDVRFRAIYDEAALPPGADVLWRNGKEGAERKDKTQALVALNRLIERYPEFIPGHLLLAKVLQGENRSQCICIAQR